MDRDNKIKRSVIYIRCSELRADIKKQKAALGISDICKGKLVVDLESSSQQKSLFTILGSQNCEELCLYDLASIDSYLESLQTFLDFLSILENSRVSLKIATTPSFSIKSPASILEEYNSAKRQLHKENIKQSLKKRKEKGLNVGRPTLVEGEKIKALREKGLSYREIAKKLQISIGSVQRGLA